MKAVPKERLRQHSERSMEGRRGHIVDFVSRRLGPLPDGVVDYCSRCVLAGGIKKFMLDRAEASKTQEDVVADVCSVVTDAEITVTERFKALAHEMETTKVPLKDVERQEPQPRRSKQQQPVQVRRVE